MDKIQEYASTIRIAEITLRSLFDRPVIFLFLLYLVQKFVLIKL